MNSWQAITPANTLRHLWGGGSRTISTNVLTTVLPLAPLTESQADHWCSSMSLVTLWAGSIANLGQADAAFCSEEHISALRRCMAAWGVPVGSDAPVTLVCQGAGFHHDADSYPAQGFCILWLSDDDGWDLLFPQTGVRVALRYGTVVLFDSALLHGVVKRGALEYAAADFDNVSPGWFLSQDFPLAPKARSRLGIEKLSSRGRRGFVMLGADGSQEDVREESGAWFARNLAQRGR